MSAATIVVCNRSHVKPFNRRRDTAGGPSRQWMPHVAASLIRKHATVPAARFWNRIGLNGTARTARAEVWDATYDHQAQVLGVAERGAPRCQHRPRAPGAREYAISA